MGECDDEGHGFWSWWFPGLSFGRERFFFFEIREIEREKKN
jgi:hypothetical protein